MPSNPLILHGAREHGREDEIREAMLDLAREHDRATPRNPDRRRVPVHHHDHPGREEAMKIAYVFAASGHNVSYGALAGNLPDQVVTL